MKNVMIVIYNSLIRLPIIKQFQGTKNTIHEITDASSALLKLKGTPVDCIILDLNLPALVNGIDLFKKIKIGYPHIPIIIINSNLDEKVIGLLEKVGVKSILNTPVDVEFLLKEITEL